MAKLFAGFFLGVIVTTLVFVWRGSNAPNLPGEAPGSPTDAGVIDLPKDAVGSEKPAASSDPSVPKTNDTLSDEYPLRIRMSGGQHHIQPQASDTMRAPTTQPEPARNTNYPPEIADMIENRVNKELHERYENDQREESWATYMEGQLTTYFGQKPTLSQFNFAMIDCRTSICEVQVLGYGPDALTQWNLATADLVTQRWHDFRQMSMDRHNPQPDVLGVVLILSRAPQ